MHIWHHISGLLFMTVFSPIASYNAIVAALLVILPLYCQSPLYSKLMITSRPNFVIISLFRDSLIIRQLHTCKFKLHNKNNNQHVLEVDGYCTCSTRPFSSKTDSPLCCKAQGFHYIKRASFYVQLYAYPSLSKLFYHESFLLYSSITYADQI